MPRGRYSPLVTCELHLFGPDPTRFPSCGFRPFPRVSHGFHSCPVVNCLPEKNATHNPKVGGSNPPPATNQLTFFQSPTRSEKWLAACLRGQLRTVKRTLSGPGTSLLPGERTLPSESGSRASRRVRVPPRCRWLSPNWRGGPAPWSRRARAPLCPKKQSCDGMYAIPADRSRTLR